MDTLDSSVDGSALATILAVHEVDDGSSIRTHMGLLVDSLMATLRDNNNSVAAAVAAATAATASKSVVTEEHRRFAQDRLLETDDLEDLQLYGILGEGANGVVLRGMMGTNQVAVKLIEMPDVDGTNLTPSEDAVTEAEQSADRLDARQAMFRNAMELAVLRSVSHVNIVQCHGVYDNIRLEKIAAANGKTMCVVRRVRDGALADGPPIGPLCTAIVTELCTHGSLAGALSDRSFPRVVIPKGGSQGNLSGLAVKGGQQAATGTRFIDMQGVYLTLLEIAMALRHLHARRLVHRDVKPANILLQASPTDRRGWTCKLADFGFALVLDQQGEVAPTSGSNDSRSSVNASGQGSASHSAAPSNGVPGGPPERPVRRGAGALPTVVSPGGDSCRAAPATPGGPACWYTVQEQACGTVTYMAPEAMTRNARIDASVDVFAFGIIMWELLCGCGNRPYATVDPDNIPRAVSAGMRPSFPENVPRAYRRLAQACWDADPASRPRAGELVAAIKALLAQRATPQGR